MIPVIERFLNKIKVVESGCWEWIGTKDWEGYGDIRIKHKLVSSHRLIYEYINGTIPKGLVIHHKCENKSCNNFAHLEILTRKQHGKKHRKIHCKRGHELIESNIYYQKGGRHCKTCVIERARKFYNDNRLEYNRKKREKRKIAKISKSKSYNQYGIQCNN